ncbi:MAG: LptF/LptG family permease [Gemmatimonadaceae bacterium]
MKILTRYILKEHVGPLAFALTALTSLLLLNQVAKQFGQLVGKGLGWDVIGAFFLLTLPFIVAMTIALAVLVSVLYAFSRLASENEVTALKASGIGLVRIITPVLWGGFAMSLIMLAFNDQVLPRTNHKLRTLEGDIGKKKPTFALREQVINEVSPGKLYLRAGHIDPESDQLREVTIYDMGDAVHRRTVYADSGTMALTSDQRDLVMTLSHGYSEESPKDKPGELQRVFFTQDRLRVKGVSNKFDATQRDDYKSEREMSVCEMTASYEKGAVTLEAARRVLADALVAATQAAARGVSRVTDSMAPPSHRVGLGRAYCQYVLGALHVPGAGKRALDAEPPTPPGPLPQMIPDTGHVALPPTRTLAGGPPILPRGDTTRDMRISPSTVPRAAVPAQAPVPRLAPSSGYSAGMAEITAGSQHFIQAPILGAPGERSVGSAVAQFEGINLRVNDAQQSVNRFDTQIQKMFALAAACVVFVLLGAPIALRFPRGGVGLVIGVSLAVFSIYYVGLIAGETLATNLYLPPVIAMWIANVVLTIIGLVFLARVAKSGATARGGDMSELWESLRNWARRQLMRIGIVRNTRAVTAGPDAR